MSIDLVPSTLLGYDCTCGYSVELFGVKTVEDLVKTVLSDRSDEWGAFVISDKKCEYEYGKITDRMFPADMMNSEIIGVTAHGGYSLMNYFIKMK